MRIEFWYVGKTSDKYLREGVEIFTKRLSHYCRYEEICHKDVKSASSANVTKELEADMLLAKLKSDDLLVLLDEVGKSYDSISFASQLQKWLNRSPRRLIFLVAGAYGASDRLQHRADHLLSLSKMTFSHQMIRLFFVEQLYRAFTILKNEKYHNV